MLFILDQSSDMSMNITNSYIIVSDQNTNTTSEDIDDKLNINTESSKSTEFTTIDSVPYSDEEAPSPKIFTTITNLKLSPSAWVGLLLMSIFGILAVILNFKTNKEFAIKEITPPLERSSEKLIADKNVETINKNFSNNIDFIAKNCSRMVSKRNSFAVFEHGTCVLLVEPLNDPVSVAKSSLTLLYNPNIGFQVKPLSNNNYIVIFDEYLSYWFSAEVLAKNKDAMMLDPRLARNENDLKRVKDLSDLEIRIGKLARLNLEADSKELKIKKIIRAKQNLREEIPPVPAMKDTLKPGPT